VDVDGRVEWRRGGVGSSDGGWMRDAGWTRRVHRRVDAGTGRTRARHATFSHEDAERHMPGVDATFDWQANRPPLKLVFCTGIFLHARAHVEER
jgi:hypothetical protein